MSPGREHLSPVVVAMNSGSKRACLAGKKRSTAGRVRAGAPAQEILWLRIHSQKLAKFIPAGANSSRSARFSSACSTSVVSFSLTGAFARTPARLCVGKISGATLPSPVYEYAYGHKGCILRCPWHRWEFDLRTGEHLVDPITKLKRIAVGIQG
jgi:hypothetical protein